MANDAYITISFEFRPSAMPDKAGYRPYVELYINNQFSGGWAFDHLNDTEDESLALAKSFAADMGDQYKRDVEKLLVNLTASDTEEGNEIAGDGFVDFCINCAHIRRGADRCPRCNRTFLYGSF